MLRVGVCLLLVVGVIAQDFKYHNFDGRYKQESYQDDQREAPEYLAQPTSYVPKRVYQTTQVYQQQPVYEPQGYQQQSYQPQQQSYQPQQQSYQPQQQSYQPQQQSYQPVQQSYQPVQQSYQPVQQQPIYPQIQSNPPEYQNTQPINKLTTRFRAPSNTQFSTIGVESRFNAQQPPSNTAQQSESPQPQNVTEKPTDSLIIGSKFGEMYDKALEAITAVAIRLEALLSETNLKNSRNFLVSPLSMAVAVGELMLGAREPFRSHLYDLVVLKNPNDTFTSSVRHMKDQDNNELVFRDLHEQLGTLMKSLEDEGDQDDAYKLRTASIIYAQRGVGIKPLYRDEVKKYYGTEIKDLDFAREPVKSQRIVNEWVQRSTNNLIKELLPGPLPSYTRAILANAVYFKADWEVPFASEINRRGLFKSSPTDSVNVTFMIGEFDNYKYVENKKLGCRMVKIPYMNDDVAMYIILPNPGNGRNEYDINGFVQELKMDDFEELTENVKERKVTMVLPKMSLSNVISMIEPLKRYHKLKQQQISYKVRGRNSATEATDDVVQQYRNLSSRVPTGDLKIDLGNMFENPQNTLNNIYQQMTLSVNEKGTEAAAISAGIVDYIMDSVVFRVDRPFLFFIRHERTKAILFWGTIVDPSEARAF